MGWLTEAGYVVQPKPAVEAPYAANDDVCTAAEMAVIKGVVSKALARAKM